MSGFKRFLLRGNLVDIAVGIVIGIAFANLVAALIKDLITPLISNFLHLPDFSGLRVGPFLYGDFINVLISFIVIAAVMYYLIVMPYAAFQARHIEVPTTRECPECLNDVKIGARRCGFCGTQFEPALAV